MHKGRSKSMQRGAVIKDRIYISREEFYSGTAIDLTEAEVKHFHFGSHDVASFVDKLEPTVRLYAKNGFRKPRDVSRLLNKEGKRTACGDAWTPRLAWFLLKLMFGSNAKPRSQPARKAEVAEAPKKTRILRPLAVLKDDRSLVTNLSEKRLTPDEIARRLSSFGRIVRDR
jgi:hypothetical protein